MSLAWPDVPSAHSPGKRVRDQLDYLAWVAEAAEAIGLHAFPQLHKWQERVQSAYASLVDPMASGHGDPLPPDVPPSVRPGTWPDVPAAGIEGMTVRHQLTVIRMIAEQSRRQGGAYHLAVDTERWTGRVQAAYDVLDHGAALPMPDSARTAPAVAPPPIARKSKRRTKASPGTATKKRKSPSAVKASRAKRPAKSPRRR